jgi:hypothetical protein
VQRAHLVMHQRNQRRDDHRNAFAQLLARNRRYLEAQRLAAARRHEHQCVAALDHVLYGSLLMASKRGVAKDVVKDGVRQRQGVNSLQK